jgi:hypothetical protein
LAYVCAVELSSSTANAGSSSTPTHRARVR